MVYTSLCSLCRSFISISIIISTTIIITYIWFIYLLLQFFGGFFYLQWLTGIWSCWVYFMTFQPPSSVLYILCYSLKPPSAKHSTLDIYSRSIETPLSSAGYWSTLTAPAHAPREAHGEFRTNMEVCYCTQHVQKLYWCLSYYIKVLFPQELGLHVHVSCSSVLCLWVINMELGWSLSIISTQCLQFENLNGFS